MAHQIRLDEDFRIQVLVQLPKVITVEAVAQLAELSLPLPEVCSSNPWKSKDAVVHM